MTTSQFVQTITCADLIEFQDCKSIVDDWIATRPTHGRVDDEQALTITITYPEQEVET